MTPKNPNTTKPRNSSKRPKPETLPDEIWLVDYECRTTAIVISKTGYGFLAFGQDAIWGFSNVQAWHRCLYDPPYQNTP
jgi:hypothetical protein